MTTEQEDAEGSAESTARRVRPATIWDVARTAGVSHQTVSRYLKADPGMRPATQERVARAIEELGYRPNPAARTMRTRRTQRVGVIVPSVIHQGLALELGGAIDAAAEDGYALLVFSADGDAAARARRVRDVGDSGEVDGVLALAPLEGDAEDRRAVSAGQDGPSNVAAGGAGAVLVQADFDEHQHAAGRLADASAVAEFVRWLADHGHRRFLHVTGDLSFPTAQERKRVFSETVEELGLGPARVLEGEDWTATTGRDAMLSLDEEDRPTAVIAASDVLATGIIQGARERGWRIPEDLSVTGWDDREINRQLEPTLTTVATDHRQLGHHAMKSLIAQLRGTPAPPDPGAHQSVIWRNSTGPAPAAHTTGDLAPGGTHGEVPG
jgi:DNA-binding LacI/PurR family transcriptional regulator